MPNGVSQTLHPGDTLVVWKLDRVARSLLHLLEMMQDLQRIFPLKPKV